MNKSESDTAFYKVNKTTIIKYNNPEKAVYLAYLIDKYKYYKERLGHTSFFCPHNKIKQETGIAIHAINQYKKELIKEGVLATELSGMPQRERYHIDENIVEQEKVAQDYYAVNKNTAVKYGTKKALFLAYLINKHEYHVKNKGVQHFYCTHNTIIAELRLSLYAIRKIKNWLVADNIICTRLHGAPAKEFYFINYAALPNPQGQPFQICNPSPIENEGSSPIENEGSSPIENEGSSPIENEGVYSKNKGSNIQIHKNKWSKSKGSNIESYDSNYGNFGNRKSNKSEEAMRKNNVPAKDILPEPKNRYEQVEYKHSCIYHDIHGHLPAYNYGQNRHLLKNIFNRGITTDLLLHAIEKAKDDNFIVDSGYNLATILSAKVLTRLLAKQRVGGVAKPVDKHYRDADVFVQDGQIVNS